MSLQARRHQPGHACACGGHAVYRRPGGRVKARADHPLCLRCWRAEQDRDRARAAALRAEPRPAWLGVGRAVWPFAAAMAA